MKFNEVCTFMERDTDDNVITLTVENWTMDKVKLILNDDLSIVVNGSDLILAISHCMEAG